MKAAPTAAANGVAAEATPITLVAMISADAFNASLLAVTIFIAVISCLFPSRQIDGGHDRDH
jgi:predicted signal transduction protein with EAL and GGDEF domain